jgi:hypothetical protein
VVSPIEISHRSLITHNIEKRNLEIIDEPEYISNEELYNVEISAISNGGKCLFSILL